MVLERLVKRIRCVNEAIKQKGILPDVISIFFYLPLCVAFCKFPF